MCLFSYEYSKCFRNSFFIEQLRWLLLNYVLVSERILKRKVSGEIAFDLISLFHLQTQEPTNKSIPWNHLSFLQNLLNFIITKYLKQEVNDDLSGCMDKCSPRGLSITGDLSISPDQKGNDVTSPNGEVSHWLLSQSCFYCPNLITVAPL